jgi:hypothetical protein
MAPQLSDDQLEQIREFMLLDAAEILFTQMEAGVIADWITCEDPVARDNCWRSLQAILQLKNSLRDAAPNKKLTERAQERRVYQT